MKHKHEVTIPEKKSIQVFKISCDICKCDIKDIPYSAEEIEVMHKSGTSYPDGGSGQTIEFDICGTCFDEKLVPWMKSQGAEPTIEEWDY